MIQPQPDELRTASEDAFQREHAVLAARHSFATALLALEVAAGEVELAVGLEAGSLLSQVETPSWRRAIWLEKAKWV